MATKQKAGVSYLECTICFEGFDESASHEKAPRLLLCGHTFCTACLGHLILLGIVKCPTCRQQSPAKNGVDSLKLNFALIELMTLVKSEQDVCELCEEKAATLWCENCCAGFCVGCDKTEHSSKVSKMHKRVATKDKYISVLCKTHQKDAEIYCRDCSEYICFLCRDRDLGAHATHKVDFINNAEAEIKKGLESKVKELEVYMSDLGKISEIVNKAEQSLDESVKISKSTLASKMKKVMDSLRTKEAQLLQALISEEQRQKDLLKSKKEELSQSIASMTVLSAKITQISKKNGPSLLDATKSMEKKFNTLESSSRQTGKFQSPAQIEVKFDYKGIIEAINRFGYVGIIRTPIIRGFSKIESGSVVISWNCDAKPGTRYIVQHKYSNSSEVDAKEEWNSQETEDLSIKVSSLKSKSKYIFRVAVGNTNTSQGIWSDLKSCHTKNEETSFEFLQCDGGSGVIVSDNKHITFTSVNGIFGSVMIPTSHISSWEIEIVSEVSSSGGNLYFGIGKKSVVNLNINGGRGKSISYRPSSGDIWETGTQTVNSFPKHSLRNGDIARVVTRPDVPKKTMSMEFFINGFSQGTLFNDINMGNDAFFPFISGRGVTVRLVDKTGIP